MFNITVDVVPKAASVGVYPDTFVGVRTALAEVEFVPFVLRVGPSEFGAEYPVGSIS